MKRGNNSFDVKLKFSADSDNDHQVRLITWVVRIFVSSAGFREDYRIAIIRWVQQRLITHNIYHPSRYEFRREVGAKSTGEQSEGR